jgi:hypothetical protein
VTELAVHIFFGYVLFPIWMTAGFTDWLFHRRTRIEATSGVRESVLHAVMVAEMGIAVLIVLFLQINAAGRSHGSLHCPLRSTRRACWSGREHS